MAHFIFYQLASLDFDILFYLQNHIRTPFLDRFLSFYTMLGNGCFLWLALCFLLLLTKKYRTCGMYALLSLFVGIILGDQILKPLFCRVRPCNLCPTVSLVIPCPGGYSFPSGHTMSSFTCVTAIYCCEKKLGLFLYPFAFLMGFSRLYLFVHFPSDVVCGAILGVITACIMVSSIRQIHHDIRIYLQSPKQS